MSYRNSPRCSHCWTTGHTKNHCPEIKKLAEQGVSWAVEHVKQQKLSVLNRKCSYCGEKGHNKRGCKHRKTDKSVYESTNNRFIRQQLNEMKHSKVTVGSLVSYSGRGIVDGPPTIGLITKIMSENREATYEWLNGDNWPNSSDRPKYFRYRSHHSGTNFDIQIKVESLTDTGFGYWRDAKRTTLNYEEFVRNSKQYKIVS